MDVLLTYRKRVITEDDLAFILKVIDEYRSRGRSFISRRLCEAWDWRQANGQLKDGVCRGLLLQLERKQLLTLPPRIIDINNNSTRRKRQSKIFSVNSRFGFRNLQQQLSSGSRGSGGSQGQGECSFVAALTAS
jgi:hypothetical protein